MILDSSVPVAAERAGRNARQLLERVIAETGEDDIGMSVVSVLELAHGIARAETRQRRDARRTFLTELMGAVPVVRVTSAIAMRAGIIDGEQRAMGTTIPLSDLLIGVTALELDVPVATYNLRHFRLIPNLFVRTF